MTTISSVDNAFFQDPRRLDKLKGREGLEAAASEFEAMFLQMVLKNMRDATKAVADENSFLASQQQDFYQSLADGQLATIMAKRGSLGIAEAMVKQLDPSFKNPQEPVALNEISTTAFQQPLNRPQDIEEK